MKTNCQEQWGTTVLRVVVGIIFLMHGIQKFFIWHLADTAGTFEKMGIPYPAVSAIVAATAESICGLLLIVGLFSRWATIPLMITLLVAMFRVHLGNGFFAAQGGYEYVLALLAANVLLLLQGPGLVALDGIFARRPVPVPEPAAHAG